MYTEINGVESNKQQINIKETQSWFFEKIYKTDKLLAKLTKEKGDPNNIRNRKGYITKDLSVLQIILILYEISRDNHCQKFLKKCKIGGHTLPDIKANYDAIMNTIVSYWQTERHINPQNKI